MFETCDSLEEIDLSNLNFSLVTDMSYLFSGCNLLKSIDLSTVQTNSLETAFGMFHHCKSLESINLINFDISLVKDISSMFNGCESLTSLDLSNFNTSSLTDMSSTFMECFNLKELNLTSFNTSLVTNMHSMFYDCHSLKSLNLSSFNTSMVKDMDKMFYNCLELISLDLPNFNIQNIKHCINMFYGCSKLKYINFYNLYVENSNNIIGILDGTSENLFICVNENYSKYLIPEISSKQCIINDCSINLKRNHIKRIYDNRKCIMDCQLDEIFKYELGNYCYDKCPKGSHNKEDNIYQCEPNYYECSDDYPFLIIKDFYCTQECNSIDFFSDMCTINNNNIKSQSILIENILRGIQDGLMDELLLEIINDKKDLIKVEYNTTYQITSSFNQNNIEYKNISIIKLGECENILKEKYNILENETLIIFKIEKKIKGLLIPLIEYKILNPKTKEQLDLNYCKNDDINISISMPVSINENILFIYEHNSNYYKDICYIYNYETETDITIYDRQIEFNNNNLSLSPKNCTYNGYNSKNKTVNCYCQIKDKIIFLDINKDDFLFKILITKKITNFYILKCYKLLFSKYGFINNIGSYIVLLVIFIYIISGIYFYLKEFDLIYNQINDISNIKKYEKKCNNKNNIEDKINEKNEFSSSPKNKSYNIKKNNIAKNNTEIKSDYSDNISNNNILNNENNNNSNNTMKSNIYIEHEINCGSYKEVFNKDKRTYSQFYISLLKERHLLIATFNLNKDYNSYTIKLCLLLFSFVLNIIINTLFFNDSLMHKIYIDKGIYNFSYNIPNILYSVIIVTIIIEVARRIFSIYNNILELKNENNKYILNIKVIMVLKCLIIKFICFFLFGILLLTVFWYYLSCFCAVYKKTQIYLIKNSLISYLIILIYPFIICLVPVTFRFSALKCPEKCLYIISQILQSI